VKHPIVIAHRGASGERPEHTLGAYRLAIAQGADVIEPDLVSTRDGVLVCRHENEISGTTDVADHERFADRRAVRRIDGVEVDGWFTEDFTLEELRTLRCRERLPEVRPANTAWDGLERIPTFDEVLELARSESARLGREIGVYPETKHPTWFTELGLALEPPLLAALTAAGWNRADAPVFIQSFEIGNLKWIAERSPVKLIQLMAARGAPWDEQVQRDSNGGLCQRGDTAARAPHLDYSAMTEDAWLAEAREWLFGIGPDRALVVPRDAEGRSLAPSGLVERAHRHGLHVHPWTFRAEDPFLPLELRGDARGMEHELEAFLRLGVDGVFCDFPGRAVAVRDRMRG
jgi:glycerophosphoryl diester phosphodiesterase